MNTATNRQLHPEVEEVLALFEELDVPRFHMRSPNEARALFRSLRPERERLPAIHHCEDRQIDVAGTGMTLRVYRPNDDSNLPILMWYHGGGWVFGDLDSGELACRDIATQAQCVVVSVDYRLAPEARFPTAVDDCIRATDWVRAHADNLSVDIDRMAVGGDSAGGNLAAIVAQHARDQDITLRHQLLVYPVTQPSFSTPSYQTNAQGYFLSRESMVWFWDHYVPDKQMRTDPRASPIHGRLDGLAPAWLLTCGFDPLCDDGLMYADALKDAGTRVEIHHRDDAIHGVFGMMIGPGAELRSAAAQALRRALHDP